MAERRTDWLVVAGLAAWAVLRRVGEGEIGGAAQWQRFALACLTHGVAAAALLTWTRTRGGCMPGRRAWGALLLLVAVDLSGALLWRPYVDGVLHLPYAKAAQQALLLMAGPLWLALLGGLRWVPEATPRRTVGAALAGVAAMCLLLREEELAFVAAAVPVLVLTAVQAIAVVWTWSYAKRALAGVPIAAAAGCGLLISAGLNGALSLLLERPYARPVEVRGAAIGLLWGTFAAIGVGLLWYWLLQRMDLAAFTMQTQVFWLSAVLFEFVLFGLLSWRVDLALAVGLGAVAVALRARPEDEEPIQLHVV